MSSRPVARKRAARIRKALRNTPPAYFDIVKWLVEHGFAKTNREARALLLARRVKSDSHPLGVEKVPTLVNTKDGEVVQEVDVVRPHVPVERQPHITVSEE